MIRILLSALLLFGVGCTDEYSFGVAQDESDFNIEFAVKAESSSSFGQFDTGKFQVFVDEDQQSLFIVHRDEPTRVIWQSASSHSLLAAAEGRADVGFARGSFSFDEDILRRCEDSNIDSVFEEGNDVNILGSFSDCDVDYELTFSAESEDHLLFSVSLSDSSLNRTYLTYASSADERFFGFGAQYSRWDMKGMRLPIWAEEQGHGRGLEPITWFLKKFGNGASGDWHTTYTAVPYYVTNLAHSIALENAEYIVFDMREPDSVTVETWSGSLRGRILHGTTPAEIVEAYSTYTGRMDPLPDWTQQGAIVRTRGGSDAARAIVARARKFDVPLAAVWIEDWAGERETIFGRRMWWNWVVDRSLYPDWENLIAELKSEGVRVLCYFNPFLADASTKSPSATQNLYAIARDRGYLVKKFDGTPYLIGNGGFEAGLVDLTHPGAREFIKKIMREQIELGVSGWMADFGEALAYDAVVASGVDPAWFHNQFTYEWAKLNREVVEETGTKGETLFFNRSGTAKSPGQSLLFWLGDQLVTWDDKDGIKTVLPGLLSAGLSGYSLEHIDTGGWLSLQFLNIGYRRTKELWMRSVEISAFTSVVRTHTTQQPNWNHQWNSDDETTRHFARMLKVFRALAPYRAKLMKEAASRGLPVVRHPMLSFSDDPKVFNLVYQFMLGSEFMVAPVLTAGAPKVNLYLPRGRWVHVWTGQVQDTVQGGRYVEVQAPAGYPAVFYREGSADGEEFMAELRKGGIL